jgi:carbonic anhydrase
MLDDAVTRIADSHGSEGREALRAMEQEAVRVSLSNLRTFPCVKEKEGNGSLKLRGAYFAITHGVLHILDESTDKFVAVS